MTRFAERFPQMIQVAEKLIWEEMQPDEGLAMLATIGTPEAYAAMRRFALSQAGGDQARIEAMAMLAGAGQFGKDETIRAWLKGEWREVRLHLSFVMWYLASGSLGPHTKKRSESPTQVPPPRSNVLTGRRS